MSLLSFAAETKARTNATRNAQYDYSKYVAALIQELDRAVGILVVNFLSTENAAIASRIYVLLKSIIK